MTLQRPSVTSRRRDISEYVTTTALAGIALVLAGVALARRWVCMRKWPQGGARAGCRSGWAPGQSGGDVGTVAAASSETIRL
jgi:hypothetical protein